MSAPAEPTLPVLLQTRHTDEYRPPTPTRAEQDAAIAARADGPGRAARSGMSLADYWPSRTGTALGLRSLNAAYGAEFYRVPADAELDPAAADEAFAGDQVVIDVQTHFVADRTLDHWNALLVPMYRALMPGWWQGMDGLAAYSMAEWLRCVFVESETELAVLTSAAGAEDLCMLTNRELAETREMFERLGAGGRLLNHTVVRPDAVGEIDAMEGARDRCRPVGWKVYTLGSRDPSGRTTPGWWLDDERVGIPFLERARDLGVRLVCAHKGISGLVDTGSPRDVGPAAAAFPDIDFVIYHSGYEPPARPDDPGEGPYTAATADRGVNRLIASLKESGIGPGGNVHAELGTTWFCLLKRPLEAAHVLGKLLVALGDDNVIWGTDACWYGPTQPVIDAFRAFQIPPDMRDEFGYPELTPQVKAKILGGNAAHVYGIDLPALRSRSRVDEIAAVRSALADN